MASNDTTPPQGQQQSPLGDTSGLKDLESRVRAIEDKINMVSGVMSVAKWLLPSVVFAIASVGSYFLGKGS